MGRKLASAIAALLLAAGCSESTTVRTSPPGAQLSVNGQFVGLTPTAFSVPRSEWKEPYNYTIAMPGYEPIEGALAVQTAPGRVVGSMFTLGVLLAFKRPATFKDVHDFVLRPLRTKTDVQVPPPNVSAPQESKSADAPQCGTDDVIKLKNSGLSDEQIRRACDLREGRAPRVERSTEPVRHRADCSLEQILAMKRAGLKDDQVNSACASR